MTTVWVRTGSEWGALGADASYIHHTIDDLVGFLRAVGDGTV